MNVLMSNSNSKDIQRFSPEVLEEIFSLLAPKDLISLAQTCTLFHKIINQSDQLWAKVCFNKFKISVPPANGFARRFYKNVLHTYGHLLGFWKEGVITYGGNLLLLKYSDGQLHGLALDASEVPNDPAAHLISKPMFTISMDAQDDHCVIVKCSSNCCINKDLLLQSDVDVQYIYKKLPDNPNGSKSPASWYLVIHNRPMCVPERIYSRLPFPRTGPSAAVPIQPGLFTLTTAFLRDNPNMVRVSVGPTKPVVLLTYDENWQLASGLQISGGGNLHIYAEGKPHFQADLRRCSYLDQEVCWDKDLPRQPFQIPEAYREKFPYLPNDCLARVHECGLLGMCFPSYWMVLTQDMFAFHISFGDRLQYLRIYHRVKDSLLLLH